MQLKTEVTAIMADVFGRSPDAIPDNASSGNIKEWDSVTHLTLIMALEDAFGITFGETRIAALETLAMIVTEIESEILTV